MAMREEGIITGIDKDIQEMGQYQMTEELLHRIL
jgi:hypothetical protein